jgi:F-type H+-transporting ATPase subunit b
MHVHLSLTTLRRGLAAAAGAAGWLVCTLASASPPHGDGHAPAGPAPISTPHGGSHAAHDGITLFNWPSAEDPRIGLVYLVINFVVLAFLIHRLILRKLVADNRARHDDIQRQVDETAAALREAQSVMTEYKARVARVDEESQRILEQARQAAAADRQRLLAEAEAEVERFKAGAMAAAQREATTRKAEIENEIVDRAIARAGELLRARLTDADQSRLVDDFALDLASTSTRT